VFAGAHRLFGLRTMDLGGRRDNHRIEAGLRERLVEVGGPMRNLEALGNFFG
jgi:hypothetical protein